MNTPQDFVNLFVDSSGELLYFIVIFVIYQGALLMALGQRARSKNELAAGRYSIALLASTLAWFVLMSGGVYSVIVDDAKNILPPLERAVNAVILSWVGWAFLTDDEEDQTKVGQAVIGVFALTALIGFGLLGTYSLWDTGDQFNGNVLSDVWTTLPIILMVIGLAFLYTQFQSAADIPLKTLFAIIIIAGHAYALTRNQSIGAIRWSMLTASALVIVLIYRLIIDRMRLAVNEVATYAETISKPLTPIVVTPENEVGSLSGTVKSQTAGTASLGGRNEALELLKALGIMLDEPETDALPRQIVYAVCQGLKADVVAIMAVGDGHWADIMSAYDQINDHSITGMLMNLDEQPSLKESIETKRQQRVHPDMHADELRDLFTRLDIGPIGPAYIQPLTRNAVVVGVLVVGFPYTHRELRDNDLRLLESIGPVAARLLVLSRTAAQQRSEAEKNAVEAIVEGEIGEIAAQTNAERDALRANLEQAQIQIRELNKFVTELENELNKEKDRVQELLIDGEDSMSITQRINVLSLEREQLRSERERLSNALVEAKTSLMSVVAEDDLDVYHSMVETLQKEYQELEAQKKSLETQLVNIRAATDEADASFKLREMIDTLTEEKAQIEADRDLLAGRLEQTRSQLQALGIEDGVVGLARQIAQLTEDRMYYKAQAERATQERETLLAERRRLEAAIAEEAQRSTRIQSLEDEVSRLMQDREALIKSRDSLKIERQALLSERDTWRGERARMLAHNDSLKMELDDTLDLLRQANRERQELQAHLSELHSDQNMLRANLTRAANERDALLARVEGDRERLREVGAEGVGALTKMIEDMNTERNQLENKLLNVQQELQNLKWEQIKLQDVRSELQETASVDAGTIKSLAQELVSPISAIAHYSDVMMGESVGTLSALQEQFMSRIRANIDRLNHLISDLVQASNLLMVGEADLNIQPVNLVDVIDDAITNSRHKFSEKGIILDLDISQESLSVKADRDALDQIVHQLIDNAYQVSPNDGIVRVTADYTQSNGNSSESEVVVAVSDRGGGVPEEVYDTVFKELNRDDNRSIPGLGTSGVSLSVIKSLIEAHHGKLWLETEEGVGTTFKFTLPT